MASVTSLRNIILAVLMAVTAAIVARFLGATNFGLYAGGTAAFNLALGLTDFGFTMVLTREMARRPGDQGRLLRATIQIQVIWSTVIALGLIALALVIGGTRGDVMLVLSPGLALAGLGASRQIFAVRYRAMPLLIVDLSTAALQAMIMIALAVTHSGVIPIAAVLSANWCVSGVAATLLARRMTDMPTPFRGERVQILRMAVPLGLALVLASLYFTVDQLLLSWLVSPRELGYYAAAVRLLSVVVMVPGYVMAAGIPGLSAQAADSVALSRFAGMLAHWIAVSALPLCVGLAVFARPAVHLVFGSGYAQAAPLLRILLIAGLLSFAANLQGNVLSVLSIVRLQIVFNVISLVVNVVGNIVLVPRYGVAASAWLTGVCEAIVVSYGVVVLSRRLSYPLVLTRVWRPICAVALASVAGLALGAYDPVSMAASTLTFITVMTTLRAWPAELLPERLHHTLSRL